MECCHSLPKGALSQCAHNQAITELLPQGSKHYAKLRCATCGEHLRFLPKPENAERRKLNGYRLTKLQMAPSLNEWERQFVDSLAKLGNNKLSPKQQAVFDRIYADHLKDRRAA
jgi:hypothetical protein